MDGKFDKHRRKVCLFTDGACKRNPGPGGWAFILRDVQTSKELIGSGGQSETTNNQMELQAVLEGLRKLQRPCDVEIYSDSQYVLNGLQKWMKGWKRNNWQRRERNGQMKPVKTSRFGKNWTLKSQSIVFPITMSGGTVVTSKMKGVTSWQLSRVNVLINADGFGLKLQIKCGWLQLIGQWTPIGFNLQ